MAAVARGLELAGLVERRTPTARPLGPPARGRPRTVALVQSVLGPEGQGYQLRHVRDRVAVQLLLRRNPSALVLLPIDHAEQEALYQAIEASTRRRRTRFVGIGQHRRRGRARPARRPRARRHPPAAGGRAGPAGDRPTALPDRLRWPASPELERSTRHCACEVFPCPNAWLSDSEARPTWPEHAEDTIALLEEEIARLEDELRLRDRGDGRSSSRPSEPSAVDAARPTTDRTPDRRADAELAAREETIALLLEQTRLADEAEAASVPSGSSSTTGSRRSSAASPGKDSRRPSLGDRARGRATAQRLLRQAVERGAAAWRSSAGARAEVERLRAKFTAVAASPTLGSPLSRPSSTRTSRLREAYAPARSAAGRARDGRRSRELQTVRASSSMRSPRELKRRAGRPPARAQRA